MILTLKENEKLNYIIHQLGQLDNRINNIFYDEEIKYKNSEYESLLIGLTNIEPNKHFRDDIMSSDIELTHYYKSDILYFITVYRKDVQNFPNGKLVINVYKTYNPQINGLNFATKLEKLSCEV